MNPTTQDLPVAIVTGASRGIGRAIAQRLSKEGLRLVLNCAKNQTDLLHLASELQRQGTQVECVCGDIGNPNTAKVLCDLALGKFGRIDVLINNAGVATDNLLLLLSEEEIRQMVNTNVLGMVWMTQAVLPSMLKQRSGCIINLSSVLATRPGRGNSVYIGTKGFVESFTRAVSAEVARKNIRVNAVAPGVIQTDMSESVRALAPDLVLDRIAVRRVGQPEEVADTVAFLISDKAAYIQGGIIPVDGGFLGGA